MTLKKLFWPIKYQGANTSERFHKSDNPDTYKICTPSILNVPQQFMTNELLRQCRKVKEAMFTSFVLCSYVEWCRSNYCSSYGAPSKDKAARVVLASWCALGIEITIKVLLLKFSVCIPYINVHFISIVKKTFTVDWNWATYLAHLNKSYYAWLGAINL